MTGTAGNDTAHGGTIRVLRGNPTPEELAAAVAVVRTYAVAAATGAPDDGTPAGPAEWASRTRGAHHRMPLPGPDAWRTTYWPR